jgi:hypothetical protein
MILFQALRLFLATSIPSTDPPHDDNNNARTTTSPLTPLKNASEMTTFHYPLIPTHNLQVSSHIPESSPRTTPSTTLRKVSSHHTTTTAWLRQLTRKQTRWKATPNATPLKRLFSTPRTHTTTTAKDAESHCHS